MQAIRSIDREKQPYLAGLLLANKERKERLCAAALKVSPPKSRNTQRARGLCYGPEHNAHVRAYWRWLDECAYRKPGQALSLHALMNEVCEKHGVDIADIRGPRKHKRLLPARREFCWRAYMETDRALKFIGRYLNRHHASVISNLRRHAIMTGQVAQWDERKKARSKEFLT